MILVFILLGFLMVISALAFILLLSSIQCHVTTLQIENEHEKINGKLKVIFSLLLLDRIPYFQITITHHTIQKWIKKKKINIQALRKQNKNPIPMIRYGKNLEMKIKDFQLMGYVGTSEPILTSYLYTFLHVFLPILLARSLIGRYSNQLQMSNKKNKANIELKCIISLRLVNIIYTIYEIKKKGGKKKNGKSSDRKSYAYSNE